MTTWCVPAATPGIEKRPSLSGGRLQRRPFDDDRRLRDRLERAGPTDLSADRDRLRLRADSPPAQVAAPDSAPAADVGMVEESTVSDTTPTK